MKQGIPEKIKLLKFSSRSLSFSHTYRVSDFPRIASLTSSQDSEVDVELNFKLKDGKTPCVEGKIKLNLTLTCQRCLDEIDIYLEPKFRLAFVKNEQEEKTLENEFETILDADDEFSTIEFITDEVLISVPITPMHDYKCVSYHNTQPINEQKHNPFAILEQLKTTKE